jgi:hypothetical protein
MTQNKRQVAVPTGNAEVKYLEIDVFDERTRIPFKLNQLLQTYPMKNN